MVYDVFFLIQPLPPRCKILSYYLSEPYRLKFVGWGISEIEVRSIRKIFSGNLFLFFQFRDHPSRWYHISEYTKVVHKIYFQDDDSESVRIVGQSFFFLFF